MLLELQEGCRVEDRRLCGHRDVKGVGHARSPLAGTGPWKKVTPSPGKRMVSPPQFWIKSTLEPKLWHIINLKDNFMCAQSLPNSTHEIHIVVTQLANNNIGGWGAGEHFDLSLLITLLVVGLVGLVAAAAGGPHHVH